MNTRDVRQLKPGDEDALEAFLVRHAASSMFLRSNMRAAGLVDRGERFQGTYAASFAGPNVVAVAAHSWSGMVLLQAPERDLDAVVQLATARSRRDVRGFAGPIAQVELARAALGLTDRIATLDSHEDLFELVLARMHEPAMLDSAGVSARRAEPRDLEVLSEFRHAYMVETLHATPGAELRELARGEMERMIEGRTAFVLEAGGTRVAYSGFNARLPDMVQVGGVYTPPELRGRGYARTIVAATLREARREGVERAILFTDRMNLAARRAYAALGFEPVGDYALVMF